MDAALGRIERLRSYLHRSGGDGLSTISAPGIGALIGWAMLVEDVEAGYEAMIEEYANDLGARQGVQTLLEETVPQVHQALQRVADPLDARFRAVTVEDGGEMLLTRMNVDVSRGWWWVRRPASGAMVRSYLEELKG